MATGEIVVHVVKAVRCPVAPSFVRGVLAAAWSVSGDGTSAELSLKLTGDRELRRLNRAFLGIDEVTDVLSFPFQDSGQDGAAAYLGDVAISWPAVVRQAAAYSHPSASELALLCVHGLLHLLGHDHATAADERAMWRETHACLRAAGVSEIAPGRLPLRP